MVGERAGVPGVRPEPGNGVGDPVAVARQSVDEASRSLHNIVIIDTAGRLGIDAELMAQAAAIRDATDPDEVLFVVDAMIGQDAVATAQAFLDGVGYDGVVLTKLDGDARGGAALSIAALTGKPVMFASTGEKLADFDIFHPDRMATRILDMGDVLTLIEQAEKAFDAEQAASIADRLMSGEGFTLEDFVEQLGMLRKLGPLKNILGMMPGASKNKALLDQVNDKDLDRAEAIVRSMTPAERRNPKIINGSRRLRIANGSGVTVGEVSQLVTNFFEGQRQMKMLMGGGMPGMPAIPGMMGGPPGARPRRQGGQEREGQAHERRPAQGRADPAAGGSGDGAPAPASGRRSRRTRRSRWRSWPRCSARRRRAAARPASATTARAVSPASAAARRPAADDARHPLERHPGRLRPARQEEEVTRPPASAPTSQRPRRRVSVRADESALGPTASATRTAPNVQFCRITARSNLAHEDWVSLAAYIAAKDPR